MDETNGQDDASQENADAKHRTPAEGGHSVKPHLDAEPRKVARHGEHGGRESLFHKAESLAAVFMVLFTAGVCAFTYELWQTSSGQLTAMNRQLDIIHQQSADIHKQTAATIEAAKAAQSAANTAQATLNQQQHDAAANEADFRLQLGDTNANALRQMRNENANVLDEQRPFLSILSPAGIVAYRNTNLFSGVFVITNYGRSVAERIRVAWDVWHSEAGHSSNAAWVFFGTPESKWHWTTLAPLPPGAASQIVNAPVNAHWGAYPQAEFDRLAPVYDGLSIYGRIEYRDPHGHRFHTDFCMFRPGGDGALPCEHHNYVY